MQIFPYEFEISFPTGQFFGIHEEEQLETKITLNIEKDK
jgi:hypothetical protein